MGALTVSVSTVFGTSSTVVILGDAAFENIQYLPSSKSNEWIGYLCSREPKNKTIKWSQEVTATWDSLGNSDYYTTYQIYSKVF